MYIHIVESALAALNIYVILTEEKFTIEFFHHIGNISSIKNIAPSVQFVFTLTLTLFV